MFDRDHLTHLMPFGDMDDRVRDIFRTIVESYLATGDPVGSRNISKALPISLSPASVRNVMSDLEQLGADLLASHKCGASANRNGPEILCRCDDGVW